MASYFFDLDFEASDSTSGLPAENYRGIPLLWTEDADSGEYVFTGEGWNSGEGDNKFGFDNKFWGVEAARVSGTAEPLYKHSFEVVNETIGGREGSFGRFELNKTDENASTSSKRVELSLDARNSEANNSETWYGFSIYIPEDWEVDSSPEGIAQWIHSFSGTETAFGPPLALKIEGNNLVLESANSLADNGQSFGTISDLETNVSSPADRDNYKPEYNSTTLPKSLAEMKGNWTDFVFHIDWEDTSNDGLIEIWIDGEKEVTQQGANTYHDEAGVYFKSGIYKWDWADGNPSDTENRVLYSDNFRIISDGEQVEGYESEFDFVAPWIGPETGDYLMSVRGGVNGKTVFASHLFEENNSGGANGFAAQPSFDSKLLDYYYWSEQNWLPGDFNGDGFDDALNIYNHNASTYQPQEIATVFTHLSDGDGFAEEDAGNSAFFSRITVSASDLSDGITAASFDAEEFLVGDFDGDGKDDIANVIGVNQTARAYVHSSHGSGFNLEPSFKSDLSGYWEEAPAESWRPALTGQTWLSGDFNGDGVDDLLNVYDDYVAENEIAVWTFHSKGDGFDASTSSQFTSYDEITGTVDPKEYLVGDFNGDGRDDLAVITGVPTPDSTNLTTSVAVHFSTGDGFENQPSYTATLRRYWDDLEWKVGDFNTDGMDDLITLYTQNSSTNWTLDGVGVFTHLSTGDGFNTPNSDFTYYNKLDGYDGVTDYTNLDLGNFLVGNFGVV